MRDVPIRIGRNGIAVAGEFLDQPRIGFAHVGSRLRQVYFPSVGIRLGRRRRLGYGWGRGQRYDIGPENLLCAPIQKSGQSLHDRVVALVPNHAAGKIIDLRSGLAGAVEGEEIVSRLSLQQGRSPAALDEAFAGDDDALFHAQLAFLLPPLAETIEFLPAVVALHPIGREHDQKKRGALNGVFDNWIENVTELKIAGVAPYRRPGSAELLELEINLFQEAGHKPFAVLHVRRQTIIGPCVG